MIADAVRKEEEERVRVRVRGKREAADAASAEAEWRLVVILLTAMPPRRLCHPVRQPHRATDKAWYWVVLF